MERLFRRRTLLRILDRPAELTRRPPRLSSVAVRRQLVVEKPLLRLLIHCNFGLGIGYLYRLCAVRGSVPADKAEWDRARVAWPVDLTNRTIPKSSAGRLGKRKAGGRYAADLVLQLPARGPVPSHSIFLYRV
jgi:hypothetical protein